MALRRTSLSALSTNSIRRRSRRFDCQLRKNNTAGVGMWLGIQHVSSWRRRTGAIVALTGIFGCAKGAAETCSVCKVTKGTETLPF